MSSAVTNAVRSVASPVPSETITVAGIALIADPCGALYWPEQGLLAVADLHLEKGSSFAERGVLLPPYDTATALARLRDLTVRYDPRVVVALGDSFHDGRGPDRIAPADRATLTALQRGRDFIWIAGNHDPEPPRGVGGAFAAALAIGPILFRHQPLAAAPDGEIAGHLHPVARISTSARAMRRRCFMTDRRRLVMPAFGAYAGGLNVRDAAFADLFGACFAVHVLGDERIHSFAGTHCLPD